MAIANGYMRVCELARKSGEVTLAIVIVAARHTTPIVLQERRVAAGRDHLDAATFYVNWTIVVPEGDRASTAVVDPERQSLPRRGDLGIH